MHLYPSQHHSGTPAPSPSPPHPPTHPPLHSAQTKIPDEQLRNQLDTSSSSAKLVLDVLKYDGRFQKAVMYACGNTGTPLVCSHFVLVRLLCLCLCQCLGV